ncbi:hypothetical protein PMAYCL1PPCAC_11155, partial [Pristionchus mayeri]
SLRFQNVMFAIGDDAGESTTTQSPETVKINEEHATRANRTETSDGFFLDYDMAPFNAEKMLEMSERKDQVSTLETQLEKERQKNLKLEDKI